MADPNRPSGNVQFVSGLVSGYLVAGGVALAGGRSTLFFSGIALIGVAVFLIGRYRRRDG